MKLKVVLFVAVVFAAVSLIPSQTAQAQNLYAVIHGTVTDASGGVIPNASVIVVNTSTGITTRATTDSKGYYTFPQLQVGGPYSVTITAAGFRSFSSTGLTLSVNDDRDVDAKLDVGSGTTTVQVSATALQVETADTQLKQIVTSEQLEEIPLEGRDPAGLQKLEPGVVESSDRFGSFSTDGSQTPQNSYLLNGVDINDGPLQSEGIQINPDALQEEGHYCQHSESGICPELRRGHQPGCQGRFESISRQRVRVLSRYLLEFNALLRDLSSPVPSKPLRGHFWRPGNPR